MPGGTFRVVPGSDVAAGTSFSLLATMNEAHWVAKLAGHPPSALQTFYLATRGGAKDLGLAGTIGSREGIASRSAGTCGTAYRTRRWRTCWQSAASPWTI
jgi:hypothetical protein